MKAWMLDKPGQPLALREVDMPAPRRGAVLVQMEAVPLLSYTRAYLEGKLPYAFPPGPFTPGTNGVGRVAAVGDGVLAFRAGQRVAVNPYWIANETVREPAQVLIGLTGISGDSAPMLDEFPHGTLREFAEFPASTLIALDGLDDIDSARLAALGKFAVPFGGLRRGRLQAGETIVVNGASGYFGSAAVLAALALGASRVVALGRRIEPLQALAAKTAGRVVPVVLSGDAARDIAAIRTAAGGGADLAFDMVGQASDPHATLAALRSLRRNGRLVLMGSMLVDLPVPYGEMLLNNWELIGNFMYTAADYLALVALVKSRQLSLEAVELKQFPFTVLESAIDAAGNMQGLQCTVAVAGSLRA
ncbi:MULTISPECIES: zinc-binding dehydrogenase [Paraburkholderia]|uniref:zinc-binding dehydrogenase n=1 Tax=Paraburkholderia TaxID=1822464 RepID=UPI0022595204|nr:MULTISPECIES: zinc-binding dehydrogenase [Paraburkholderia]MCX4163106.1 zinc-binding dehydrogenase [Paraburkholderia megapolitana]MDN7158602.1 zinc-binding dehydrogenase [Paraburkholderia sp. CHISQ3]MDQ6495649.1 zinc-binding dehydrogenase [Paraburkholderia megapolitana]